MTESTELFALEATLVRKALFEIQPNKLSCPVLGGVGDLDILGELSFLSLSVDVLVISCELDSIASEMTDGVSVAV